ncbi:MAG: hypothetical protein ACLQGP_01885 [Isosphaeraceae bacterium]
MDASQSPIWFIGDLSDPWILAIAESIARDRTIHRLDCPGSLPSNPFDRTHPPRLIVVHRCHLGLEDIQRLMDWRAPQGTTSVPAMFLCVSPYVRYVELERVSRLVDLVVSEAMAAEVLPRHVRRLVDEAERQADRPASVSFRIEVACGTDHLGRALLEAIGAAGYRAEAIDDHEIGGIIRVRNRPGPATERVLTIWEIPVLEPGWAERLEWRALRTGPVIALAGFADRAIVVRARAGGASACLELPCDLDDLIDAIDHVVRTTDPESWPVPPRAEPAHALPPHSHRNARRRGHPTNSAPWSDRGPLSRIP